MTIHPSITFSHVSKVFSQGRDSYVACRDLDFSINEGEIVAIVGETGCGKSTAMQLLLGLQKPTGGTIEILGHDPFQAFQRLRGLIGIVFQTDRLLPWRTAAENIEFGLQVMRVPKWKRRDVAAQWLERLGLSAFAGSFPHQLSGGMRQRIAIARTFAIEPRVLLADEAFSALDEITAAAIRSDLLRLVREQRTTTIFITHSVVEAADVADRILVFGRPGHVVRDIKARGALGDAAAHARVVAEIRDALGEARGSKAPA
jgi:NitT/TauT family transport system ATP-binding protein